MHRCQCLLIIQGCGNVSVRVLGKCLPSLIGFIQVRHTPRLKVVHSIADLLLGCPCGIEVITLDAQLDALVGKITLRNRGYVGTLAVHNRLTVSLQLCHSGWIGRVIGIGKAKLAVELAKLRLGGGCGRQSLARRAHLGSLRSNVTNGIGNGCGGVLERGDVGYIGVKIVWTISHLLPLKTVIGTGQQEKGLKPLQLTAPERLCRQLIGSYPATSYRFLSHPWSLSRHQTI